MGSVNITKSFILDVNVQYNGKAESLTFDVEASMYDDDTLAVPEYNHSIKLQGKSVLLSEDEIGDLIDSLDLTISNNFSSIKDGSIEQMNCNHFDTGLWDIDFVNVGSAGK